jgi:hypothetical protein
VQFAEILLHPQRCRVRTGGAVKKTDELKMPSSGKRDCAGKENRNKVAMIASGFTLGELMILNWNTEREIVSAVFAALIASAFGVFFDGGSNR